MIWAQVHNNQVVNCIVADPSFINSLPNKDEYHLCDDARPAGIGWAWSNEYNRAIPPQPFPSWTLNGWIWTPPTPKPDDDRPYLWNEDTQTWELDPFFIPKG